MKKECLKCIFHGNKTQNNNTTTWEYVNISQVEQNKHPGMWHSMIDNNTTPYNQFQLSVTPPGNEAKGSFAILGVEKKLRYRVC